MKFKDIPQGTHFVDDRGRRFIKLQNILPSTERPEYFMRVVDPNGYKYPDVSFNSIDYNGISATCPDWVDYTILIIHHFPFDK